MFLSGTTDLQSGMTDLERGALQFFLDALYVVFLRGAFLGWWVCCLSASVALLSEIRREY